MIERMNESWRLFASGRAGIRFRERYWLHQSRRKGRCVQFDLVWWSYVTGGFVLVALSALFGWLPVLG